MLCTTSLLCSLGYLFLLYFLYIVSSQLKCLHICHHNFDLSAVDHWILWRQAKQSMWEEVEWLCWHFFFTCMFEYLPLNHFVWLLSSKCLFPFVWFRNLRMAFGFDSFPFSVHNSNTIFTVISFCYITCWLFEWLF